MKSMQRKFGGLMKRSDDQQDVSVVLAEFKAVDEMLNNVRGSILQCQLSSLFSS